MKTFNTTAYVIFSSQQIGFHKLSDLIKDNKKSFFTACKNNEAGKRAESLFFARTAYFSCRLYVPISAAQIVERSTVI